MHPQRSKRGRIVLAALGLALATLVVGLLLTRRGGDRPASVSGEVYEKATQTFYRGLASLDVGLLDNAGREFTQVTELAPREPAAWANLGLVRLRLGELDAAAEPLRQAAALAPESGAVALLLGQMEIARGRLDEGVAHLRRAVDLDPRNLRARFALAQQVERSGAQNADALAAQQLDALLEAQPDNLTTLLERTRLAIKQRDAKSLHAFVERLGAHQERWSDAVGERYDALTRAADARSFAEAARAVAFLRNLLLPTPAFQESLTAVSTSSALIGEPLDRFLSLPSPRATPSPPDEALTFAEAPVGGERTASWTTLLAVSPDGTELPMVIAAGKGTVGRIEPRDAAWTLSNAATALVALDWNYDFKMDLVTAGPGGVRLLLQGNEGPFSDATAAASRGDRPVTAATVGVWAADLDMEGDVDIIVGLGEGAPLALRNNGDGTWRTLQPFPGVDGLRAFAWGDLDGDGDPDAALLDSAGRLYVFANRQAGLFERMAGPDDSRRSIALTVGDVNADSLFDVVTLEMTGRLRRASYGTGGWTDEELTAWRNGPTGTSAVGSHRLFLADVDNNGALDLLASGPTGSNIWLAGAAGRLVPLPRPPRPAIFDVVDLDGDGQLDLVGLSGGRPVSLLGSGTMGYHWQVVRPRAQTATGDQRINSFGIGGEIEIRSGLLTQKQPLTGPVVHFGLGTRTTMDVARILWPNGVVQAEFDHRADTVVETQQRLKGSCPWVFTYDGSAMRFVTDFLWRSPLGLRINAQDTAGVTQTEDWIKIRGDQLVAHENAYDVRITSELWETQFVDHVSLMVVDHPANVEVFVDERFAVKPSRLAVHATRSPRPVRRAWDHQGRDVTALVSRRDGRYAATFERGTYQGVAKEHFVELELDQEIPPDAPFWLLAQGWIYPTDSSINVAIGQGDHPRPRGLTLEAQDETGRWRLVSADLGFPAGKNKTILIDLRSVAEAGLPRARRLRLRTNLEISWDWLATARGVGAAAIKTTRLSAARAELRYRGFSQTSDGRGAAPETPQYSRIANVGQRWRDLVGYYTRYGDVRDLLARVDDRYVIMNAGDELRTSFAALPPPTAGWRRDFVLIGDGWVKDGDYNTKFSKTVEPLPSHGRPEPAAQVALRDDPVYRRHADDWERYHTRFVTPQAFLRGLRPEPPRP